MKEGTYSKFFRDQLTLVTDELGLVDFSPTEGLEKESIIFADPITSDEVMTTYYVMRPNGYVSRTRVDDDCMIEGVYLNRRSEVDEIIPASRFEQFGLLVTEVMRYRK